MFEFFSLLSTVGSISNKNLIWSIFVFYELSLYLLPMEIDTIQGTYDILRVNSRLKTGITSK